MVRQRYVSPDKCVSSGLLSYQLQHFSLTESDQILAPLGTKPPCYLASE
jgi:serine/threonine protein kinase